MGRPVLGDVLRQNGLLLISPVSIQSAICRSHICVDYWWLRGRHYSMASNARHAHSDDDDEEEDDEIFNDNQKYDGISEEHDLQFCCTTKEES